LKNTQFENILMGFAFSPNLKANVYEAMRLSSSLGKSLFFLHVGAKSPEKQSIFKDILNGAPMGPSSIKTIWESGDPVKVITHQCKKNNIDLLLLGALQRENVLKFYLGSIARKLTRKAPCSVFLMIKPSIENVAANHMVVNAFKSNQTEVTIRAAFEYARSMNIPNITLVDEINQSEVDINVDDDFSLKKSTKRKEELNKEEGARLSKILSGVPKHLVSNKNIKSQNIFGTRGYSISHYAKIVRADILVINSVEKRLFFLSRIFPKDLDYILSELPTDVLIIKPSANV
jgi:nucleotide-binding universal stress UspA family protein